mgnify:CR=1 FL=1
MQTFYMTLDMKEYEGSGDMFQGFVRTIKHHMTKENKITRRQLAEIKGAMEKKIETCFDRDL